jgi:quercetin dioxygenase-like cupin family protein
MRLHIICGALLLAHGALAQKPSGQKEAAPVKLKVPPLPPSTMEPLVAQLANAAWVPAQKLEPKMPPGADIALIGADPVSSGVTSYMRLKGGYKVPAHWHAHIETDIMISGKGSFTIDGKKVPSSPGSYIIVGSKAKHDFSCDTGADCLFIVHRSGPTEYNWVAK